jgi:hypothetical protein
MRNNGEDGGQGGEIEVILHEYDSLRAEIVSRTVVQPGEDHPGSTVAVPGSLSVLSAAIGSGSLEANIYRLEAGNIC